MTVTPILRDVAARRSREQEEAQGASIPPLTAQERLELLCDVGSLRTIRSTVSSRRMGEKARAGDGVVAGAGEIDGRPIFCYAQDARFAGGSLGEAHANSIVRVLELAGTARVPVIGFVESGGARMQEGTAALGRLRAHLPPERGAVRAGAADLGDLRHLRRRRLLLARAHGLRDDDQEREHVPHRPRRGGGGAGRAGQRRGARRAQGARAQRRLPVRGRGRRRVDLPRARAALVPAAERVRARARAPVRAAPSAATRAPACPWSSGASTTCATWSAAWWTAASCSRWPSAGRATWWWASLASRAAPWASWPTTRTTSAAASTRRPRRRPPASCAPATRSGCRSWCSWTPPGSSPARSRRRAA